MYLRWQPPLVFMENIDIYNQILYSFQTPYTCNICNQNKILLNLNIADMKYFYQPDLLLKEK